MYKPQIIFGNQYGDLEAWITSLPGRFCQTRVKDRMEAVLRGETVEPIPNTGRRPTKYSYQLYVTEDHPYLHDFLEFLDKQGYKYGPHCRWLLFGEVLPKDYVPFEWQGKQVPEDNPARRTYISSLPQTAREHIPPTSTGEEQPVPAPVDSSAEVVASTDDVATESYQSDESSTQTNEADTKVQEAPRGQTDLKNGTNDTQHAPRPGRNPNKLNPMAASVRRGSQG